MATTTVFEYRQGNPDGNGRNNAIVSGFATIDNGETATLPIPNHGRAVVRLGLPTLTGTSLTFTVQPFPPADPASPTANPGFSTLRDRYGNIVRVAVGGTGVVEVPELSGCYAFTIVSSSAEGSARRIEVQMVGANPVPFEPASLTPWNTAIFTKADVTAGGATAWTTANSPLTLFTVTGTVQVRIFAVVTNSFTSTGATGTLAVGTTGNTGTFMSSVTVNGSKLTTGQVWAGTTQDSLAAPTANGGQFLPQNTGPIILTIGTNNMTAGGIIVYCQWIPVTSGATVVAS